MAGDLPTAQNWVDTAWERPWPQHILDEYQGSLLHMARAKLALERGAVDDAVDALARVWHIVDTIEHWPLLAVLRASCDLQAGRIEEGRERLRTLRAQRGGRLRGGSPFARGLELAEASLALAAGDLVAARRLTARASDAPKVLLGVARVALFDGQDDRALRLLSEVPESGPAVRAGRAVLQAIVLHRLGRGADSAAAVRRAGAIARAFGLRSPFLLLPASEHALFAGEIDDLPDPIDIDGHVPQLTARERVVLRELVHTASTEEIAERLHVSANTVKSQRRSLYRKLGAASREQALASALAYGLLDDFAAT